jgi:hypothetical protein
MARLTIEVYPRGQAASVVHRYRLACNPARGTVPHLGRACRRLTRLAHPFKSVLRGAICSGVILGPQEAV